jgi:hypothetical protein
MDLIFHEDGHRYEVDGVIKPSITQILRAVRVHRADGSVGAWFDYGFLTGDKSREALERGRWVAELAAERVRRVSMGPFPPATLAALERSAPDWFAYFPPFERWLAAELADGFAPLMIEQALFSPTHDFAGRPDLICIRRGRRPTIIEIKTGIAPDETAVQTALQELLLHDQLNYPYRGQRHDRFALELAPGREARMIQHLDALGDRNLALAALTIFRHHHQGWRPKDNGGNS